MNTTVNKIHLFRSIERAEQFAKKIADAGVLIGHKCTTPRNFALDLVQMFNPDVKIIDDITRTAFIISLTSDRSGEYGLEFFQSGDMIWLLSSLVKITAGTDHVKNALEEASEDDEVLSAMEVSTLDLAENYRSTIAAFGYCELGEAAALVADQFRDVYDVVWEDECECDEAIFNLISTVAKSEEFKAPSIFDGLHDDFRNFSLYSLSEKRAVIPAICDLVSGLKENTKTLIITGNTEETYAHIKAALSHADKLCSVHYRWTSKLSDTFVGQAMLAMTDLLYGLETDIDKNIIRLLNNPLLGISVFKRTKLDADMRKNPVIARKRVIETIKNESVVFDVLARLVDPTCFSTRLEDFDCLDALIQSKDSNNIMTKHQKEACSLAIATLRQLTEQLGTLGLDGFYALDIFDDMSLVSNNVAGCAGANTEIHIAQSGQVVNIAPEKYDTVFFYDTSTVLFNASTKFDSLYTLLEKIGYKKSLSTSEKTRLGFFSGIYSSNDKVILCYPERDLSGSKGEMYPSFTLQEFFINYAGMDFDKDNAEEICHAANIGFKCFGEDSALQIVGINNLLDAPCDNRQVYPVKYKLDQAELSNYLAVDEETGKLILSPSQIESYLQCSYKWFYNSRINPKSLDFELDASVKGSLVHSFFKIFYDELFERGVFRLVPETFDQESSFLNIDDIFEDSFLKALNDVLGDDTLQKTAADSGQDDSQESSPTGIFELDNCKVTSFADGFELQQLKQQCYRSLLEQSLIPDDYIVAGTEVEIKPEQKLEYASVIINGRADRVDACEESNSFLVIDYKGGIDAHEAGFDCTDGVNDDGEYIVDLPGKIQALIYASCIQKLTGKHCDGAIYLSYNHKKKKDAISGSLPIGLIDEFDAFTFKKNKCAVHLDMDEYLMLVEKTIAERLENLKAGDITPNPKDAKTCTYCPVANCPYKNGGK
ncbi:MAG: PD-(D/E)XK nuclease family protein [Phoenicibacter congonensis]|uniref:PD-(D/E)XK nuclease family protein n=1 Tax=Phoenicibacter congonensis TaxID=1944646 RepID=A0AA43UAP5_9ACTN|nr:PD-(D/E)XK nuclease family protein [Phoenicibacter congonensis]